MHLSVCAHTGRRRAPHHQDLELEMVESHLMWVPGAKLKSCTRAMSVLTTECLFSLVNTSFLKTTFIELNMLL